MFYGTQASEAGVFVEAAGLRAWHHVVVKGLGGFTLNKVPQNYLGDLLVVEIKAVQSNINAKLYFGGVNTVELLMLG